MAQRLTVYQVIRVRFPSGPQKENQGNWRMIHWYNGKYTYCLSSEAAQTQLVFQKTHFLLTGGAGAGTFALVMAFARTVIDVVGLRYLPAHILQRFTNGFSSSHCCAFMFSYLLKHTKTQGCSHQ